MKKLPFSLRCFAHCIQGQRLHMEDYYSIAYQKNNCIHEKADANNEQTLLELDAATKVVHKKHVDYVYFGIFDGHGGKHAAEFAQAHLLEYIVSQDAFWKKDDESILNAIKQGFLDTHAAMLNNLPEWPKTIRNLPSTSGTTASVLFIKNGKYYTGHVGDSRIVLGSENPESKQWIAQSLTVDHKPESPEEKKRIQDAGGAVHNKSGVDRVVWQKPILRQELDFQMAQSPVEPFVYPVPQNAVQGYASIPFLAVARSLGDLWSINSKTGKYVVSPEPDVAVQPISPNDRTLILASDGLWNMVSSADAVRLTQELADNVSRYMLEDFYIADKNDIAKSLVYYAYQQWTSRNLRSDNTSAVVVLLEDVHDSSKHNTKDHLPDSCIECSCNYVSRTDDNNYTKEPPISLGDRFIYKGSFDLIDFQTDYPIKLTRPLQPGEKIWTNYQMIEECLKMEVSVPPGDSSLTAPLSYVSKSDGESRILNLADGTTVTVITLPNDDTLDSKETEPLITSKSGKKIKNTFTQANRKASQTSPGSRNDPACNYDSPSVSVENVRATVPNKTIILPDIWPNSAGAKVTDDSASSKKENAIITEIQKVVQRVSPSEVGSIKRKFEGSGLDSIPCIVEALTGSAPIKSGNDIMPVRYDMRRRMLESSNGENLNRSQSNLRARPRKRIRVGSTSPSSKYSPPYRHLRSLSLRKASHQSHLQSSKNHQKQSIKDLTKARSVMRVKNVRAIASSLSNKLPKTRLRPRHGQRLPRRTN